MKVLMVDYWGQANLYALNLSRALADLGVDLSLLTVEDVAGLPPPPGFRVLPLFPAFGPGRSAARKLWLYLGAYRRALALVRSERIDLVHLQYVRRPGLDLLFMVAARAAGARIVYTAHNVLPHEPGRLDPLLFSALYRTAHRVLATSSRAASLLRGRFGIPAHRVDQIPIGYTGPEDLAVPERDAARSRLGLSGTTPYVVALGGMRPYKGLDDLFEAVHRAAPRVPGLRVLAAGPCWDTRLQQDLAARIERLGLTEAVAFLPRFLEDEEMALHLAACDLVALPYKRASGHSAVLMMAYFTERPVLATRVGGLEEAVEDGETGFLTAPEDPEKLASVLVDALSDRPRLRAMGAAGRRRLDTLYAWPAIAARTVEAYRTTQTGERPPRTSPA